MADGQAVYGAPVARRIAELFGTAHPATPAFPDLTPREREVLELLATGARNSEIAQHLGMTDKTLRNHVSAILTKLQVPTDRRRDQGPRRAVTRPRRDNLYPVIGADGTEATHAESAICAPRPPEAGRAVIGYERKSVTPDGWSFGGSGLAIR